MCWTTSRKRRCYGRTRSPRALPRDPGHGTKNVESTGVYLYRFAADRPRAPNQLPMGGHYPHARADLVLMSEIDGPVDPDGCDLHADLLVQAQRAGA